MTSKQEAIALALRRYGEKMVEEAKEIPADMRALLDRLK